VLDIFDRTAADYDRVERMMGLGSGSWYRRRALQGGGLRSGMRVLDIGAGTGLVARAAALNQFPPATAPRISSAWATRCATSAIYRSPSENSTAC